MTAPKYHGGFVCDTIAMRGFRLVLCFVGLAIYLLLKQFVAVSSTAPRPVSPVHEQGNFAPGGEKLELMQEPDLVA